MIKYLYMKKKDYGFTILELLVVLALVGVLAAIILVYLGSAKTKANDSRINHQISDTRSQASLYKGGDYGDTPLTATNQPIPGKASAGLFMSTTLEENSLHALLSDMPSGTWYAYAGDGGVPSEGGQWIVMAALSDGALCTDWSGDSVKFTGASPASLRDFMRAYPNAEKFLCK
jgi:prepilin-type N-terminal cleavage/methylation domain-containing protein